MIENNHFFLRNPYSWEEINENPIFCAANPIEEYPASNKAEFDAFIVRETEHRKYFFDFVEIEKIK